MDNNKALGSEKISKLIFKFSLPSIIALLINALYNIIDQIFIGNSSLGFLGNAATSVVFPILVISFAFAWCFGDGAVALMSIRQGQKDNKGIAKIVGNAIVIDAVISVVFIVLSLIFIEPLLRAFGASDMSLPLAESYFRIILCGLPASMIGGVLSSVIRADGSPAFSMVTTVLGAVINVILDPIFIFGLDWGIEGAAFATIIAQIISFAMAAYYVLFRPRTFKLRLDSYKLDFRTILQFTKLGVSTFITQISIVATALVGNMMLAKYGAQSIYGADIPIAAMGIAIKVFAIVINIVVGLSIGSQPILGYNYGAGEYGRVKETFKVVIVGTTLIGLLATVIFEFFPDVAIAMFGMQNDLYVEFARKMFRIFLLLSVFTLLIKAISIFFQAVGEPKKATIASLVRDLLLYIPLSIALPIAFGIDGVLYAAPIADTVGIIIAGAFAIKFYRNLGSHELSSNKTKVETIRKSHPGVIITIARQHGSAGKEIGKLVAEKLKVPYYYKELLAVAARESGLSEKYLNELNDRDDDGLMRDLYLSSTPAGYAIEAQRQAIQEIAKNGSCVIVGRAADYVLRDNKNVLRVFISAPDEYRIKKLGEMYGDSPSQAKKSIKKSDSNRASYYNTISGLEWGARENYDLCLDSSIGNEATAKIIVDYAKSRAL